MVHLSHPEPWVWVLSAHSFDRRTRGKTWPVVDAEIPGAAAGWCVFILWGLCVVSTVLPCPEDTCEPASSHDTWGLIVMWNFWVFCKWEVLHTAAWTSSACVGGDVRLHCCVACGCPSWNGHPPAGLILKWGTGRAAPGASPLWPSSGTCGFPAVGLLSVHLSGRGWALVVLKFHSCVAAGDHQDFSFRSPRGSSVLWVLGTWLFWLLVCHVVEGQNRPTILVFVAEATVPGCNIFCNLFFPSLLWKD